MKIFKVLTRLSLLLVIAFAILHLRTFRHVGTGDLATAPLVSQSDYLEERNDFVGQQIRLQGIAQQSYYLLGVGVYRLVDSHGQAVVVICNHYPPDDNALIEILAQVQPLFKLNDNPSTLLIEVKVPQTLLSFQPKNNYNEN